MGRREREKVQAARDAPTRDDRIRADVQLNDARPETGSENEGMKREELEHPSLYDPDYFRQSRSARQRTARQQNADVVGREAASWLSRSSDVSSQRPQPRRSNVLDLLRADSPPRHKHWRQDDETLASTEFRSGDRQGLPLVPGEEHRNKKLAYIKSEYTASNRSDPLARWYTQNSSAGPWLGETSRFAGEPSSSRTTERRNYRMLRETFDRPNAREKGREGIGIDLSTPSRSSEWQAAMPVVPSTISQDHTANAEAQQRELLKRVLR